MSPRTDSLLSTVLLFVLAEWVTTAYRFAGVSTAFGVAAMLPVFLSAALVSDFG
ncbi:hypothetical protein NDI76_10905 [Halogeometricum sp. S1BR25-6]|uniref:Uncharacterized protein n=1 Tax=Halogeometricum salsisoli TaxID=2950536 RepID=A0ABU2GEQ8_9EURY|nr:hypothetical protein [Halogeometricum sp. S1BR25-6]MDS0299249.1 hypothetical protein [Halogeometricum sp. S1BR25-6]